jgi:hypothetical protein
MDTARVVAVLASGGFRVAAARGILSVGRAFRRAARGRRRRDDDDDDDDVDARVVIARAGPARAAPRGRDRARACGARMASTPRDS